MKNISVGNDGRVYVGDEELKSTEFAMIGGANSDCGGTTNTSCTNNGNCRGSRNTSCTQEGPLCGIHNNGCTLQQQ